MPRKLSVKSEHIPQLNVEPARRALDRDFIAAFRLGRIAEAHRALDAGANPSHATVHAEMLGAGADSGKRAYRAMWQLYFEMRGPFGDAEEIVDLSRDLLVARAAGRQMRDAAAPADLAPIARAAIVANIPRHLLPEVGGRLLADAVLAADPATVRLLLDRGADAGYVDAQGNGLLQLAATAAHPEVLQQLVAVGLDPQRGRMRDGRPLLMAVAATVTRSPVNAGTDAETMQRYLARRKQDQARAADALRVLLSMGLNANAQWSPSQQAVPAIAGAAAAVNPVVANRHQPLTALQAAMRAHNPLAVDVLLAAGARTGGAHQKAFAAAFAQHMTTAFDDATVDALRIVGMLKSPRKPDAATSSPLQTAVAALAARRWSADSLAPIAPARRAAWASRLNRALSLPRELLPADGAKLDSGIGRNRAAADLAAAFMAAVQARLPGAAMQLAAAGALPDVTAYAPPKELLRVALAAGPAAVAQLKTLLDARADDAPALGQAWNALIAHALLEASVEHDQARAGSNSATATGKVLWSKVALLRHAHQSESLAVNRRVGRAAENAQRTQLLRTLARRLAGLSWQAQWEQGLALLAARAVTAHLADSVAPVPKTKHAKKTA